MSDDSLDGGDMAPQGKDLLTILAVGNLLVGDENAPSVIFARWRVVVNAPLAAVDQSLQPEALEVTKLGDVGGGQVGAGVSALHVHVLCSCP